MCAHCIRVVHVVKMMWSFIPRITIQWVTIVIVVQGIENDFSSTPRARHDYIGYLALLARWLQAIHDHQDDWL